MNPFSIVLASKKDDAPVRKGKEAKMAQWEADVRKSLANKKPANGVLSKQDQAAIQAQLEKEQGIRQKVFAVKTNLERGLHFIQSLVVSNTDEFKLHLSTIAALLVDGALRKGDVLVSKAPFDTYIVSPNHTPVDSWPQRLSESCQMLFRQIRSD